MYEPKVSIITPTFNIIENEQKADFDILVQMLDRQTYPYVEHIVVDAGSDDGTVDILKDYKNRGYLSFIVEKDNGKFDAMNKGILQARGKYISFMSCDDFYHDITAIEGVVQLMGSEDADYCFFPVYCQTPDEKVFIYNPSILNVFQVVPCPRQAMFFKKKVLEELNFFDTKFRLMSDYDLIIRLIMGDYVGVMLDQNIATIRSGVQTGLYTTQVEAECRHIFYKNYNRLYPLDEEALDRLVEIGEIPVDLLEKLGQCFAPEIREAFYQAYEQMYNMRVEVQSGLENEQDQGDEYYEDEEGFDENYEEGYEDEEGYEEGEFEDEEEFEEGEEFEDEEGEFEE